MNYNLQMLSSGITMNENFFFFSSNMHFETKNIHPLNFTYKGKVCQVQDNIGNEENEKN